MVLREFIELENFTKKWKEYGLTDEELFALEYYIGEDPERGDIIVGGGGVRKN